MPQQLLFVPVRPGRNGAGRDGVALRMFRTPLGTRTAVAFTGEAALRRALGPDQRWVRLAEPALRALAEPLGAARLTVDPLLTARRPEPVSPVAAGSPRPVAAAG